jgi:hypothetical protein
MLIAGYKKSLSFLKNVCGKDLEDALYVMLDDIHYVDIEQEYIFADNVYMGVSYYNDESSQHAFMANLIKIKQASLKRQEQLVKQKAQVKLRLDWLMHHKKEVDSITPEQHVGSDKIDKLIVKANQLLSGVIKDYEANIDDINDEIKIGQELIESFLTN